MRLVCAVAWLRKVTYGGALLRPMMGHGYHPSWVALVTHDGSPLLPIMGHSYAL